jgi:hypothetical protein
MKRAGPAGDGLVAAIYRRLRSGAQRFLAVSQQNIRRSRSGVPSGRRGTRIP